MRARLDAIVHRVGGMNPCYVSEHDCSMAKDKDFYRSLSRLKSQVSSDLSSGFYSPGRFDYARPFATFIDALLPLRDGSLRQSFFGCAYEAFDDRGREEFISICPTNYLSEEADSLEDSLRRLGEVIEARYVDERVSDLVRELPRAPLVTTIDLKGGQKRPSEVSAVIERDGSAYRASSPALPLSARGSGPSEALQGLEDVLSEDPAAARGYLLRSEAIFGTVDVRLILKDSFSVKRFLISLSPCQNGTRYFRAMAPQAGVFARSATIEGALHDIRDAISLKYHEASIMDVEKALKARPILTTARIGPTNN